MPIFDKTKGKLLCRTEFDKPINLKKNESLTIIMSDVKYTIEYDSFRIFPNNGAVRVVFIKDGVDMYVHDCVGEVTFFDVDGKIVFSCMP